MKFDWKFVDNSTKKYPWYIFFIIYLVAAFLRNQTIDFIGIEYDSLSFLLRITIRLIGVIIYMVITLALLEIFIPQKK